MKIVQILDNMVHYDMTPLGYGSVENARQYYAPDILIVEAPDNVFEGYGYDEETGEFLEPQIPEGWGLNRENGTFYLLDGWFFNEKKMKFEKSTSEA